VHTLDVQNTSLVWTEQLSYLVDINGHRHKNINFSTTFPSGEDITFIYYLFSAPYQIDYTYINFTRVMPAYSFKAAVSISGWKPVNMSNMLAIAFNTTVQPAFQPVSYNYTPPYIYTILLNIGSSVKQYFNLLDAGVVSGVAKTILGFFVYFTVTPQGDITSYVLWAYFPMCNDTFFYDPDFSVIVQPQDGSSGDGTSTSTILIASLVPTFVIVALFMIVLSPVLIVVLYARQRSQTNRKLQTLNDFARDNEDSIIPTSDRL